MLKTFDHYMKILIAPDKFKGTLSAESICAIIEKAILQYDGSIQVLKHPMADGGDGTLDLLKLYLDLDETSVQTVDPLGRKIEASYVHQGSTAYIELASASGYVLLNDNERSPLHSSTYGTGLMIRHAIENGFSKIVLLLGGSATNDAGTGILHALGFKFKDKKSKPIRPSGITLSQVEEITHDQSIDLKNIQFKLFCDVNNPLYGPSGAAFTYAKQKGASPEEIVLLDKGLKQFAQLILNIPGKDINAIPGAGAAGGVPAGIAAFLNSEIVSGTQELIQLTGLENKLTCSDIIISGEGCVDEQSTMGKVVHGVQSLCVKHNKPLYLFAGISRLESNSFIDSNRIYTTSAFASSAQESIDNAEKFLIMAAEKFIQDVLKPQEWIR